MFLRIIPLNDKESVHSCSSQKKIMYTFTLYSRLLNSTERPVSLSPIFMQNAHMILEKSSIYFLPKKFSISLIKFFKMIHSS